jgi:predicted phosphohydrolase
MKIFAIGDLHLPGAEPKPMNIFGDHWANHWGKIRKNWIDKVRQEDVVLLPGDINWAMNLEDAQQGLEEIGVLPGRKIILRGNHDYWWTSISKVRAALPPTMFALQNDSCKINGIHICGTRGWVTPGSRDFTSHDQKIFYRELNRLKLSLSSAEKAQNIIVMLHYPPFNDRFSETDMMRILKDYPVSHVVYAHLHGADFSHILEGCKEGITYHLVSCDYLNFDLKQIIEL